MAFLDNIAPTGDLTINPPSPPPPINAEEFEKVVRSRRSVRVFEADAIPDEIVHKCIDLALLAPNSSNLQPWEFYRVKTPGLKAKIVEACLSQPAAKTAAELIVCVGRTRSWKSTRKQMLEYFAREPKIPQGAKDYYQKLVPFAYAQGPLGVLGFVKWLLISIFGVFKPIPRGPFGNGQMRLWASKTCALACQNLMLAFRAYGYDTCPMEGFDEKRVKRALGLSRDATVVMVVSAGKRSAVGIYGAQVRFPRSQFVFEV